MEHEKDSSSSSQKPLGLLVLVGTLVASFAALFLSKLKTPVEQSAESPHPPNSFDQRCEKAKPRSPTAVRIGSYPPPPTTEGAEDEDKEERFLKRGNFIAGIVTALIALGLLSVTYRYTKYTYKMWQEMQSQTKTAREQLELSERPWIKVNFTIGSQGFAFQEGGAQLPLQAHFQNVGHSVATSAFINVKMFLADDANGIFKQPLKRQHELCDPIVRQPVNDPKIGDMTLTIFPGDTDSSMVYGVGVGKEELESAKNAAPKAPGGKRILPIIVGCADYQYGTSERHHQTRFIYEVQRLDRKVPPNIYPIYSIEVPKSVAPNDVVLIKYGFGGFTAD